jgi:hypothetical protein
MIIPVITAIVLYKCWNHVCAWWEFMIPFGVSLVLCFIMKISVESVQTSDTEWWTGTVVTSEYYEPYDEEVPCRHPKYKTVKNPDGTTSEVQDGYEHAYDVDYHPAYWQAIDSNGVSIGVNEPKFNSLCQRWNNKSFVNMNRHYHSINGNKYVTGWDNRDETCEVCVTSHRYKNKLLAANSVFKFPEPDSKEGLFEYPKITGFYDSLFILGGNNPQAERKLAVWNAKHGHEKKCRLMFLVYKDLPIDVALNQENHWQGGNKNEFLVSVGVDDGYNVKWCHIISWTDNEQLKAEVKNYIIQQEKLDLETAVDAVGHKVMATEAVVRKDFREFDYLTVDPPMWTVLLTFFLTLAINIGMAYWIINNDYD